MDSTQTYLALKDLGIQLRLNPSADELLITRDEARLLSSELRSAIKENREYLIRAELFDATVKALSRTVKESGITPGTAARNVAWEAFGEDGRYERLNHTWLYGNREDLKEILKESLKAGRAALQAAGASVESAVPDMPVHEQKDNPGEMQLPMVG